jgi:hypothetical protein
MASHAGRLQDDAVYKWFLQKPSTDELMFGPLLCEKALLFSEKIGGPSTTFQASTGWLKRLKSHHGIRGLHIEGEKLIRQNCSCGL